MTPAEQNQVIQSFIAKGKCDLFIYSGLINYTYAADFVDIVCQKSTTNDKCLFLLATPGGDPHAAFRMIRALRGKYKAVRLGIDGPCKSAGTLIAIGASEIVMSSTGELGPLDVQVTKPDEVASSNSGLDIFQALAVTSTNAFDLFERWMMNLIEDTNGAISTRMAAETAREFVVGLFAPITAQIDPNCLGEVQRAIKIAHAYAERLGTENLRPKAMIKLVEQYPSHGFVIDFEEARTLFKSIVKFTDEEAGIVRMFRAKLRHYDYQKPSFQDIGEAFKLVTGVQDGKQAGNTGNQPNIPKGARRSSGNGSVPKSNGAVRAKRTSPVAAKKSRKEAPRLANGG